MTERADQRSPMAGRSGFVLVMTLLLLGLLSAGAVAIMIEAKAGATGVAGLEDAAHARAVAQAGAARAAYGSMVANDPLRAFAATEAEPARWRFDGRDVALSATPESDRIDLNEGRPELVDAMLGRANLDEALRGELMDAVLSARGRGEKLAGAAALMRPCLRLSAELRRLENVFTVATRARGVALRGGDDPNLELIPTLAAADRDLIERVIAIGRSPLDDRRLGRLQPYLSDRSSHYRVTARTLGAGRATAERRASISLAIYWPHVEVTASRWSAPVAGRTCD